MIEIRNRLTDLRMDIEDLPDAEDFAQGRVRCSNCGHLLGVNWKKHKCKFGD